MGPVYATRLTIFTDPDHPAETLHHRTVELCHAWLASVAGRYEIDVSDDPTSDLQARTRDGLVRITAEHLQIGEERAWRGVVLHPYSPYGVQNQNLQLRAEIVARDEHGEEVVTIRLLIGSLVDHIRPLGYRIKAPRLVRELIDEFQDVFIGNVRATTTARHVTYPEMPGLIDDILRDNRFAPLVVVSRDIREELACDPEAIAREILGLGRVYVLSSYAAAYELSDRFGANLGCYEGAVRLYWPGFAEGDSPYDHPLWLADRIRKDLQTRLPGRIFGMIAAASSVGITSDTKVWNLYQSATEARTQEVITRAQELANSRVAATEQDYLNAIDEVYRLKDEKDYLGELLKQEGDDAKSRIYELEAEKDFLQHQIQELRRATGEAGLNFLTATLEARTVADVLRIIERLADPSYLVILDAAHASAAEGHFNNGLEIAWHNLLLVLEGAKRFHDDPSATLQETMRSVGATDHQFKADTSDTARKMHLASYQRCYERDGQRTTIEMGPHIKNGKGNANRSLCIYWYVDLERRTFVVGHVGRKLPDSTGGYS